MVTRISRLFAVTPVCVRQFVLFKNSMFRVDFVYYKFLYCLYLTNLLKACGGETSFCYMPWQKKWGTKSSKITLNIDIKPKFSTSPVVFPLLYFGRCICWYLSYCTDKNGGACRPIPSGANGAYAHPKYPLWVHFFRKQYFQSRVLCPSKKDTDYTTFRGPYLKAPPPEIL